MPGELGAHPAARRRGGRERLVPAGLAHPARPEQQDLGAGRAGGLDGRHQAVGDVDGPARVAGDAEDARHPGRGADRERLPERADRTVFGFRGVHRYASTAGAGGVVRVSGGDRAMNIETALKEAMNIEGALGVALVDWESGMPLGTLGGGKYLDLDLAGAGNAEVVRAKMRTMQSLQLNDMIEDILITLGKQYHLIRLMTNADGAQNMFLYLALDRSKANLALARHQLMRIEGDLVI
jgi:hypothetical protein